MSLPVDTSKRTPSSPHMTQVTPEGSHRRTRNFWRPQFCRSQPVTLAHGTQRYQSRSPRQWTPTSKRSANRVVRERNAAVATDTARPRAGPDATNTDRPGPNLEYIQTAAAPPAAAMAANVAIGTHRLTKGIRHSSL